MEKSAGKLASAEVISGPVGGTFRDPQGRLYQSGDCMLREIYPEHVASVLLWIRSPLAQRWMQESRMVSAEVLSGDPAGHMVLAHPRIFFPSYPWEWTPGQWKHAALLSIEMCEESLESGYILKDATPLNVLFTGPRAVFVDVLSFERRDPQSPLWVAYAQFVRTFLMPLVAYIHLGWPLSATLQRRDGYEPADLAPWLPWARRWRFPLRPLVTLPLLLQKRVYEKSAGAREYRPQMAPDAAAFAASRMLRKTRRLLEALDVPHRVSRWSDYTDTACHYGAADHAAKQGFVRRCLEEMRPLRVLDVGANTGMYSRIAAEAGAEVVAWDSDVQAVDANWKTSHSQNLRILPVVADFARPTPAVGWGNGENASLLTRAQGQFDCVLMLGLLHHLLLADQIPLEAILEQVARISKRWAILEWIPKEDSQFTGLCRGRDQLYERLTIGFFAEALSRQFAVARRENLPNGRSLWLVEKNV